MRQALRAADARNDAKLDFRLTEFGIVRGDDEIALHGKFAAAAERKAGDRGDDRLAGSSDAMPSGGKISKEDVGKSFAGHFLDIGAGCEGLVGASDDDAADIVIGLERVDG